MGSLFIFLLCVWLVGPATAQEKPQAICLSPFRTERSVEDVARDLGIVEGKAASISPAAAKCCDQTDPCRSKGGVCLPYWFKKFFSCYDDKLCYSRSCTCILFNDKYCCKGGCSNPNGKGVCRHLCYENEVSSNIGCNGLNCKCCTKCSGTCSGGGTCRKTCSTSEIDSGACPNSPGCRCCRRELNCGDSCGFMKTCSWNCRFPVEAIEREESDRQISIGLSCPSKCPCCRQGDRSMEAAEDAQPEA